MICPAVFKGPECRYSGRAKTCNKTLKRCRQLGNVINWRGGQPYVPAPDSLSDRIAKMADPFARHIAAQLNELAVQIYQDPRVLFDWEIHVDAMVNIPRLKALTVRVRIKPDGESA